MLPVVTASSPSGSPPSWSLARQPGRSIEVGLSRPIERQRGKIMHLRARSSMEKARRAKKRAMRPDLVAAAGFTLQRPRGGVRLLPAAAAALALHLAAAADL